MFAFGIVRSTNSDLRSVEPINGTLAVVLDNGRFWIGSTGQPVSTYVNNGTTILVPAGGDGSSAWLRIVEDFDSHIINTSNPHGTDIGNLGSGTLAELNSKITDATLDDSGDPRTPTAHAATHITGGSDEIDGDRLDIDWNPTNYIPTIAPTQVTSADHLTAHLAGIDITLGSIFGSAITNHGELSGLGDDDHPQYLLITGTRAMSGSLNMGTNNITNVGTVDGRDISADASTFNSHIANSSIHFTAQSLGLDGYALDINLQNHISNTSNPHGTDIGNLGSGTLAELNSKITDANLDTAGTARTPTAHAATHITGGSDEIDGDRLDIDWNPTNYTPTIAPIQVTSVDHLTAHLAGIDAAIATFSGSIITDHGALTGRGDDDHTQYLLVSGTRAMSNSLNMGGNSITSVNLVDGVDVSSHASRHISAGADEIDGDQLDIDWNPSNYTPTISPIQVTSLDHLTAHLAGIDAAIGTKAASSITLTAGAGLTGGGNLTANRTFNVVANADGSIVVNANDVQVGILATDAQHGDRGGGSLHALATTLTPGFMSAAQVSKLNGINSGAQVNTVTSVFGRTGAVAATDSDYNASQIDNDSLVSGLFVDDALNTLNTAVSARALSTVNMIAGNGLTGGGTLAANRTFNVGAAADGSIVVAADTVGVGILASDAQHGVRGGGTQHAVATTLANGFMSSADKTKLNGIAAGAQANTVTSVFGRTGAVGAAASDYVASQIDNDSAVSGLFVDDALNTLNTAVSARALSTVNMIAGNGLTGGGTLAANRTFNVVAANPSITVNADSISVGVLQSDAQHGVRGGGTQHAVATTLVNGFMSAADKVALNSLAAGSFSGPASSADNALARYDGTTGKVVQNSDVTLSDAGAMAFGEAGRIGIGVAPAAPIHVNTSSTNNDGIRLTASASTAQMYTAANDVLYLNFHANTGNSRIEINPTVSNSSQDAICRFFRNTDTTGNVWLDVFRGTGSLDLNSRIGGNATSRLNLLIGDVVIGSASNSAFLEFSNISSRIRVSGIDILFGTISNPSGNRIANPGSLYLSSAGTAYLKESGTGTSGWARIATL